MSATADTSRQPLSFWESYVDCIEAIQHLANNGGSDSISEPVRILISAALERLFKSCLTHPPRHHELRRLLLHYEKALSKRLKPQDQEFLMQLCAGLAQYGEVLTAAQATSISLTSQSVLQLMYRLKKTSEPVMKRQQARWEVLHRVNDCREPHVHGESNMWLPTPTQEAVDEFAIIVKRELDINLSPCEAKDAATRLLRIHYLLERIRHSGSAVSE